MDKLAEPIRAGGKLLVANAHPGLRVWVESVFLKRAGRFGTYGKLALSAGMKVTPTAAREVEERTQFRASAVVAVR